MNKTVLVATILIYFSVQVSAANCAQNGQGNVGSCTCLNGYYGTNAEVGGQCNQCPTGTTTTAPPSLAANGNTSTTANISACNQCAANFYMTAAANTSTPSQATCQSCPTGTSNTGVTVQGDVSQCNSCLVNYYMTGAATTATGSVVAATATCYLCPAGTGNTAGPTNAGDVSQCNQCQANFYMTLASSAASGTVSATAATCSACPANSYSSVSSVVSAITSCTCFDSNAATLSSSITSCTCKNGYQGNVATSLSAATGCTPCGPNLFSTGGSTCAACATGSSISSDQGSCTCYDTSTGTAAWTSTTNVCQCKANYYGDPSKAASGGSGSCTACPTGQQSAAGSTASTDCSTATANSLILSLSIFISLISFILY